MEKKKGFDENDNRQGFYIYIYIFACKETRYKELRSILDQKRLCELNNRCT